MNTNALGVIVIHMVILSHPLKGKESQVRNLDGNFKESNGNKRHMLGTQTSPM